MKKAHFQDIKIGEVFQETPGNRRFTKIDDSTARNNDKYNPDLHGYSLYAKVKKIEIKTQSDISLEKEMVFRSIKGMINDSIKNRDEELTSDLLKRVKDRCEAYIKSDF